MLILAQAMTFTVPPRSRDSGPMSGGAHSDIRCVERGRAYQGGRHDSMRVSRDGAPGRSGRGTGCRTIGYSQAMVLPGNELLDVIAPPSESKVWRGPYLALHFRPMARTALARIVSAALIVVMSGATNAPILDAIVFHGRNHSEIVRPHYSTSTCHAERCAIQYTARDSRPSPEVLLPVRIVPAARSRAVSWPPMAALAPVVPNQHRPRAPPSFV
jgi:hypothetical protein